MATGKTVFVWAHGTKFRVRAAQWGGCAGGREYSWNPTHRRTTSYRISVNEKLIDCAPTKASARRLCERWGRKFLARTPEARRHGA